MCPFINCPVLMPLFVLSRRKCSVLFKVNKANSALSHSISSLLLNIVSSSHSLRTLYVLSGSSTISSPGITSSVTIWSCFTGISHSLTSSDAFTGFTITHTCLIFPTTQPHTATCSWSITLWSCFVISRHRCLLNV